MTSLNNVIRTSALAAVLGGALLLAADLPLLVFGPIDGQPSSSIVPTLHSLLCMLGTPLLVLALPGLYLHQAEETGQFGLVAFFIALLGTTLMVSSDWFEFFVGPAISDMIPGIEDNPPTRIIIGFAINFVIELTGWLLFGIATLRARVFPRPAAMMLIVGIPFVVVGPVWATMVWNGGVVLMGLAVLKTDTVTRPIAAAEAG